MYSLQSYALHKMRGSGIGLGGGLSFTPMSFTGLFPVVSPILIFLALCQNKFALALARALLGLSQGLVGVALSRL